MRMLYELVNVYVMLIIICLLALYHQPSTATPQKGWKGMFLNSSTQCHQRCVRKHGYFVDPQGGMLEASVGKVYAYAKCHCMMSYSLKEFITSRFGAEAAESYSKTNFYRSVDVARAKLEQTADAKGIERVEFISQAEFEERRRKMEEEKRAAAEQARAAQEEILSRSSLKEDPSKYVSQKHPRRWRGWFLFSKTKCQERCRRKHGYFIDPDAKTQDASVGKVYLLKCQCLVSRALKQLLVSKFGAKVASWYSRLNFYGYTQKARIRLAEIAEEKGLKEVPFFTEMQLDAFEEKERHAIIEQAKTE